ncbi:ArsR/SmtB family transcription factor [Microbacterium bovistercoris]|uniref:ArsR/SmtB family transcription factor n=1 Tax=Microbacterium bovistercoris TaxID=2293570 RepID=UPI0015F2516F|nr:metalloregulator ArsR/SmtB family transcription factor [Microbacterium bovistercoris]
MTDPSDAAFRALADPTRRRILDLLADRGVCTVGELAEEFPELVASGISKHLMALRAAGLVVSERDGRNQRYRIDANAFQRALGPWMRRYDDYLATSLQTLKTLVESGDEPPVEG